MLVTRQSQHSKYKSLHQYLHQHSFTNTFPSLTPHQHHNTLIITLHNPHKPLSAISITPLSSHLNTPSHPQCSHAHNPNTTLTSHTHNSPIPKLNSLHLTIILHCLHDTIPQHNNTPSVHYHNTHPHNPITSQLLTPLRNPTLNSHPSAP